MILLLNNEKTATKFRIETKIGKDIVIKYNQNTTMPKIRKYPINKIVIVTEAMIKKSLNINRLPIPERITILMLNTGVVSPQSTNSYLRIKYFYVLPTTNSIATSLVKESKNTGKIYINNQ